MRAPCPGRASRREARRVEPCPAGAGDQPPTTSYIPLTDVRRDLLADSDARSTWCEFKGAARYLDAIVDGRRFIAVGWSYPDPAPKYGALRDHVAFYAGRVDAAWLDDERVHAQESDFYGGWITSDLVGPFKGQPARSPGNRETRVRDLAARGVW